MQTNHNPNHIPPNPLSNLQNYSSTNGSYKQPQPGLLVTDPKAVGSYQNGSVNGSIQNNHNHQGGLIKNGESNQRSLVHNEHPGQQNGQSEIKAPTHQNGHTLPPQSFENTDFKNLVDDYQAGSNPQKTMELAQAFMMSTNIKEVAGVLNGANTKAVGSDSEHLAQINQLTKDSTGLGGGQVSTGAAYFHKQDLMSDLVTQYENKEFDQIAKLLNNLGTQDKSTNLFLEQRGLSKAQADEGRILKEVIDKKIVAQDEYLKIKEKITLAKIRAKQLLQADFTSDTENQESPQKQKKDQLSKIAESEKNSKLAKDNGFNKLNGESQTSETQDDSGQAQQAGEEKRKTMSIKQVINQIRQYGHKYLSPQKQADYDSMPLSKICKDLRKLPQFSKKRGIKFLCKSQQYIEQLKSQKQNLVKELSQLTQEIETSSQGKSSPEKIEIGKKIKSIETVLGLENRLKQDKLPATVTQLDMAPMTNNAFDIQNILQDFCGFTDNKQSTMDEEFKIDEQGKLNSQEYNKRVERLFGKIRKLPSKSTFFENQTQAIKADKKAENNKSNSPSQENKSLKRVKEASQLIKVVGLDPSQLFKQVKKYSVNVEKMPKFSNDFDQVDNVIRGIQNKQSIPGCQIMNSTNSNMLFQRIDGRNVISLQFNPHFIGQDEEKKKIYESYMKDINEYKDKANNIPDQIKLKQEEANLKKLWVNIAKKDIPKAFRLYQKFRADQDANNKKLSQNCLKEVRKKAVKTQRLAKESVMRARKLTKEMQQYWRKRDKEIADTKRKREKLDKEMKKKLQEEEEAMLQKKRLEYLMQQSEIYAHFMSKKLGTSDDLHKGKNDLLKGQEPSKAVDIDKRAARIHIAGIINENRKRLDDFDDDERDSVDEEDLDDNQFKNPTSLSKSVQKPKMFKGDLKAYQLKGLQWLDNLYEQGINGILADEMGLGKTIQTISLLAHLAETKNCWGPFLVVVPVTTLHNWQNELTKFCPDLRVLPYFGSAEERKKLAKFLDPKNMENPAMRIHVLITSYNLIVGGGKDQARLQKVKWRYMILDEAQAIKNNSSRRWKTLLNFQTRNRLLLSGTPIQNSMAELWALLHFIMPKLFDNHEQFQEWFSKDIEQHSMDQGELNKHQLKRLHLILQPFMLRRLKRDVEQEIAPKTEETIYCDMSHRQKVLYDRIKSKISAVDLFHLASNKSKVENLMNLVMQFRKVCNHPDLFERRLGKIPFAFSKINHGVLPNLGQTTKPEIFSSIQNPISFEIPKMVYDECLLVSDNSSQLFQKQAKGLDISMSMIGAETHFSLFNIFNPLAIFNGVYKQNVKNQSNKWNSVYPILGLLSNSNSWSFNTLSYLTQADPLVQGVALMHFYTQKYQRNLSLGLLNSDKDQIEIEFNQFGMVYNDKSSTQVSYNSQAKLDIIVRNMVMPHDSHALHSSKTIIYEEKMEIYILPPLINSNPIDLLSYSNSIKKMTNIFYPRCVAETINFTCPTTTSKRLVNSITNNPMAKKMLVGASFKPAKDCHVGRVSIDRAAILPSADDQTNFNQGSQVAYRQNMNQLQGLDMLNQGILKVPYQQKGSCTLQLPDYSRLVSDCAKMKVMADLLARLHKGGHRCLVFCQMTRMMDILEDFLIWQKYSYFRMDGSTQLEDRRFMVDEYQTNPSIFCFILSTRAGGLGINLIAADTVIFYDNDWNPTMDSQATDRAHRIGQKKKVHVYRLVTKNTVEERILRRARQKENVQSTVYAANLKADSFSSRDVVDMIIDDIDDPLNNLAGSRTQVKGFIQSGAGGQKANSPKKRRRKNKNNDLPEYESINRIKTHDKYDNEIDLLINGESNSVNELVDDRDVSDGEGGQSDQSDTVDIPSISDKASMDKRKLLLKLLEQSTGGKKQVFNFEEDENGNKQTVNEIQKKKPGRPLAKNQNDNNENESENEEMGDGEGDLEY